jgi:parallel beta-helix repeat protein
MRGKGALTAIGALAALVFAGGQAQAALSCGKTVTHDVKLKKNLTGCPGDGLVAGASNITINLNGHKISGQDTGDGVSTGGFDGVVIKGGGGGQIAHFEQGVAAIDAANSRVKGLKIKRSYAGVAVGGASDGSKVLGNTISEIELYGIGTAIAADLEISGNEITGPTDSGLINAAISVNGTQDTLVEENVLLGGDDGDYGIIVNGSAQGAALKNNEVRRHQVTGIAVYNGAAGTVVKKNEAIANGNNGIQVENAAGTGTRVLDNDAHRNGNDGLAIEKSGIEVGDNVANDNGTWGIFAVPGVVDLGGNKASGNAFGQCSGVTCT